MSFFTIILNLDQTACSVSEKTNKQKAVNVAVANNCAVVELVI